MRTLVDCLLGAIFFALLLLFQSVQDDQRAKIEAARLEGVTHGAKVASLKCGTVAGYINVGQK